MIQGIESTLIIAERQEIVYPEDGLAIRPLMPNAESLFGYTIA